MKIAVLLNRLSGGGAEHVGTAWAEGLIRYGHDVEVIVTHQPDSARGYDCVSLTAESFPSRLWKLTNLIRQKDYDVVVSLMPHWNVLSLLASLVLGRRTKTVISLHSLESGMARTHGLSFVIETLLARLLYPFADAVVGVSHAVAAEAKAKYGVRRRKLWVLPNPVLEGVTDSTPRDNTKDVSVALVFAGRLVGQKKPEVVLLCAAALLREGNIPDVRVEFFGAGPLESRLRCDAERLNVPVVFHGWSEDWSALCPPDAVVVLPSTVEGFGNVLVEAAAKGVPSVASSRALGVADALLPGVTGVLAAGDQIDDYCEAIRQAILLPPFEVSSWLKRFTAEHAARSLDKIIGLLGSQKVDS